MTAAAVARLAGDEQLAEAALAVARFVRPDLDMNAHLSRLDGMAARVDGSDHLALRRIVSIAEGYGGNVDDYYDPANSLLDQVLATRRGLPLTLSIIWMEVGRRAGIPVEGVALPGHFLVFASGQLVDPFHGGEAIGREEAAALVAAALGGPPRLDPSWLEPVISTAIIRRLLANLEHAYHRRHEHAHDPWIADCRRALGSPPPE